MRWLPDVIDQMLAVIPENESDLRRELEWHKVDASFKAPEQQSNCWHNVANYLTETLTEMDQEWQWDIQGIFAGEIPSEEKEDVTYA